MALDLEQQENISFIKEHWRKWGKWFFYLILTLGIIFLFNVFYTEYSNYRNEKASNLLDKFLSLELSNQNINSLKILKNLQQKYPRSIPTSKATLMIAGNAFELGNYNEAKNHYNWVIKHQKDSDIRTIAILRYATVLIQENKYNEALIFLKNSHIDPFYEYVKLDLQGDIYNKLGKKDKAVENYKKASSNVDDLSIKEYFKIKLNI